MTQPDEEPEIFVPSEDDRDPDAESTMHMGKVDEDPGNALHDPWFESPEQAQSWEMPRDFVSDRGDQ
ncbi:MAG TPA: hypothetical protein VD864_01060 [Nocardioides sp.]|nr:hypothetical protein [Nocardioides sp.]